MAIVTEIPLNRLCSHYKVSDGVMLNALSLMGVQPVRTTNGGKRTTRYFSSDVVLKLDDNAVQEALQKARKRKRYPPGQSPRALRRANAEARRAEKPAPAAPKQHSLLTPTEYVRLSDRLSSLENTVNALVYGLGQLQRKVDALLKAWNVEVPS